MRSEIGDVGKVEALCEEGGERWEVRCKSGERVKSGGGVDRDKV